MEDTLRVLLSLTVGLLITRLNPCFNGRYSQRAGSFVNSTGDYVS